MKKAKTFLAKVLAAAVMVTSVLPGALTANAAPVVVKEDTARWMYDNGDGTIMMDRARWIDLKTGDPYDEMFGEPLILGKNAIPTWHFQSTESDQNDHGDLSLNDAAATVYASKIDIKSQGVRRVMQFDLTQLNDSELRFGIMLKYVDKDHWIYLGQVGGKNNVDKVPKWMLEWKNGTEGGWCNAGSEYAAADGTKKTFNPAFANMHLGKEKWNATSPQHPNESDVDITGHSFIDYLRVTLTYESPTNIKVRMAELEQVEDEDGNQSFVEKADSAKESTLDLKMFGDIRTAAGDKPIHFGFLGGTYGSGNSAEYTDINVMNVQKGALAEGNSNTWTEALSKVNFSDCGWMSPKKGANVETLINQQVLGDADTYASIGDPDNVSKQSPDATIYSNTYPNIANGTVSADLRPYTVGDGKEFYLGITDPKSSEGTDKSFKIGINGTKWVYSIDGTETEITGQDLPAIAAKTDYDLSFEIDEEGAVTASVTTEADTENPKTVDLIKSEDSVKVENLSGAVSLTAKGEVLRARDVTFKGVSHNKTPLEEAYDTIKKANANNEFYTDVWNAFAVSSQGALKKAEDTLNGEHKDKVLNITPQSSQNPDWLIYDELFDEAAATALNASFATINVAANKVETGKAELQAAFDAVMTPQNPNASKWYSAESLAAYTTTWNAVKDYLETTLKLGDGFAGVTKAEVDAKKAEIQSAPGKLKEKTADKDYLDTNLTPALTAALEGIDLEDEANNAKYYNNWTEFKNAADAAKALQTADPAPSIKDVDAKIAALNTAKENLTLKTVTSVSSYQSEIAKYTSDTITEDYYKGDFAAYTQALQEANGIKVGDILKDADAKIQTLKAAYEALSPKTLADDAAATKAVQDEINAIKAEVAGKKYVQNDKWTAYTNALAAIEALMAKTDSTKFEVEAALDALKEAKAALTVDTTPVVKDPVVGSDYADAASGMKYKVGANQTLELTEGNKTVKSATIDTVTINGKAYKVTAIAPNAFKNAKLTKVTIGDNIITINKNAFASCKALKTVVIGKNVKTIKANAFSKCTKINTVTFKQTKKLPSMKNAFKNANKKPKKIQVAKALVKTGKKKNSVLKTLKKAGFKKITVKNIKGK